MIKVKYVLILVLVPIVAANPFTNSIYKRNVCDWKNAEPILYRDYNNADCPPPITLDSETGNCPLVADAAGVSLLDLSEQSLC